MSLTPRSYRFHALVLLLLLLYTLLLLLAVRRHAYRYIHYTVSRVSKNSYICISAVRVKKKKPSPRRRTDAYLYHTETVLFSIRWNRSMKDRVKNRAHWSRTIYIVDDIVLSIFKRLRRSPQIAYNWPQYIVLTCKWCIPQQRVALL